MNFPNYKDWPSPHKKLAMFMLIACVGILLFAWLYIIPQWTHYRTALGKYERQVDDLSRSRWSANSKTLRDQLTNCLIQLNGTTDAKGLIQITDEILENATNNFLNSISETFPEAAQSLPEDTDKKTWLVRYLLENSTRLEYKDICDRLESEFKGNGLKLNPANFELKEDNAPPTYQMIIRVWTIQAILRLATAHNLVPVADENGFSEIQPMPVIYFSVNEDDEIPYLIEFPIQFTFAGKLPDFLNLLHEFQTPEFFYPLKQLEIKSIPPADLPKTTTVDSVRITMICSSFMDYPQSISDEEEGLDDDSVISDTTPVETDSSAKETIQP